MKQGKQCFQRWNRCKRFKVQASWYHSKHYGNHHGNYHDNHGNHHGNHGNHRGNCSNQGDHVIIIVIMVIIMV